jgi:putative ABC transport system substrate-binding protein
MALVGIFMNLAEDDAEISARRDSFLLGLGGGHPQIALRFGGGLTGNYPQIAQGLVGLNPDVLVGTCWPTMNALQAATSTIPIVFTGLVNWDGEQAGTYNYGGNVTGIVSHESSHCKDWVKSLSQIAPAVTRVGVIYDPNNNTAKAYYQAIQNAAPGYNITTVTSFDLTMADPLLDSAIHSFANTPNGGLIVVTSTLAATRRDFIISRANKYDLPAMYPNRMYTANGYSTADNCGLISHGPNASDYQDAGDYVKRILGNPAHLPSVKNTPNFELVINLNAAAAIGLNVPGPLLNQAALVIE